MQAHGARELMTALGISRASAYRLLRRSRTPDAPPTTTTRTLGCGAQRQVLAVALPEVTL
jgi:hypothetical protein